MASKLEVGSITAAGDTTNGQFLATINNTGSQSEDNGLIVQVASSGESAQALAVQTGGDTNAFRVTGSGEVGIGLSASAITSKFHVNGLATFSAGINVSAGDLGVGTTNPDAGTNAPTSRSSVGRLNSYTGTTAEIADSGTLDIALTMQKGLMAYLVESNGNSNYMSAGFFRSNNNGASSAFTFFGQSESNVAVTTPSAGNIRITNNTGVAITFFYAITVIAG